MSIECEKVGGINLAQGVCDTETPEIVRRMAGQAIESGVNSYTRFDGLPQLRQAIAHKLVRDNDIEADPESQIIVTGGSTGAFYCACLALLDPGDEIILFEPYYGYHVNTLLAAGAVPSYVTLRTPNWSFSPEDLEAVVTPKTKGIMINTPANPSGKVFTQEELEWIADFSVRYNLIVFTDEIYEYFVYDGLKHISPASLRRISDRTITISGFSKTFSVTGWRVGYCVAKKEWAQMIGHFSDLVYVCAPAPLQMGLAAGLEQISLEYFLSLKGEYVAKREKICSALYKAKLQPFVPQGAYYVLADTEALPGLNSKERARYLLAKTGVAGVPGEAFFHGPEGQKFIRFCFAKTESELDKACRRLEAFSL